MSFLNEEQAEGIREESHDEQRARGLTQCEHCGISLVKQVEAIEWIVARCTICGFNIGDLRINGTAKQDKSNVKYFKLWCPHCICYREIDHGDLTLSVEGVQEESEQNKVKT